MSGSATKTQQRERGRFARALPRWLSDPRVQAAKPKTVGETDPFAQAVTFCLGPVMFGLLGRFLDDRLGTHPLLLVIGIVLGFVGSSLTLYYRYQARIEQLDADKPWNRTASAPAPAVPVDEEVA